MHISNEMFLKASKVLGLDEMSDVEREVFISTLGNTILENALLKFLASQGEWEQESFGEWVKNHAANTNMLEELVMLYPSFGVILSEEIMLLKTNLEK